MTVRRTLKKYAARFSHNIRFKDSRPHIFRIGDIVEVQVSFVVVPQKDGKKKMMPILRSLALLDASFTKVNIK